MPTMFSMLALGVSIWNCAEGQVVLQEMTFSKGSPEESFWKTHYCQVPAASACLRAGSLQESSENRATQGLVGGFSQHSALTRAPTASGRDGETEHHHSHCQAGELKNRAGHWPPQDSTDTCEPTMGCDCNTEELGPDQHSPFSTQSLVIGESLKYSCVEDWFAIPAWLEKAHPVKRICSTGAPVGNEHPFFSAISQQLLAAKSCPQIKKGPHYQLGRALGPL